MRWQLLIVGLLWAAPALADSDVPSLSAATSLTGSTTYLAQGGALDRKLAFNTTMFGVSSNALIINSTVIGSTTITIGGTTATIAGLTLTAPTFTTPALGTPASGNAANLLGLPLSGLAAQAANTVVGNATSGSAVPTALAMTSCSTAGSAVIWTTNTGFGCNTSIAAATATTASAVAVGGITGLGTNVSAALAQTLNGSAGPVGALTPTNSNCVVGNGSAWTSAACPGGGTATVTANSNTETAVTTFAFGTGFNVPGGSSGSAAITLAVIPVTDATASRTLTGTDGSKLIHMTNGAATAITLPDSATVTSKFGVNLVCDAGCTVTRAGSDTVNGGTSVVVAAKAWASIATDGAGVFLLGIGPGAVTGTGSMVQATSPTLVTPILGTPTSGNGVNMTGYTVANLAGAGTGVLTAAAANLSANGGLTTTIASGAKALATGAIGSAACTSAQTDTATNTATTDVVLASFNGDPTGVTGYVPLTAGMLTIIAYPTSGTVNFKVCNNTNASITPGAITLNWRVVR